MTQRSNKLVRDHIPDIIRSEGRACETEILDEAAFRQALMEKLVEEALEVAQADHTALITEVADLYEVLDAVLLQHGITREDVAAERHRRRAERGGFERRIQLIRVEEGG